MRKGLSTMRRVKMSRVVLRVTFLLPLGVVVCGAWAQTAHPGGSGSAYAPPLVFRRAQRLRRGAHPRGRVVPMEYKPGLKPENLPDREARETSRLSTVHGARR